MGFSTGHGAVFSLLNFGVLNYVRSSSGYDYSGPVADVSHLGSTIWRNYLPPDLYDLNPFTLTALVDNTQAENLEPNVFDTLTITMPLGVGEATPASLVGSVVFTRVQVLPPLASNQENLRELELAWLAHPAWTPATETP